jgi:hypothetical protein
MAIQTQKRLKAKGKTAALLGAVVKAIVPFALGRSNTLAWFLAIFSDQ